MTSDSIIQIFKEPRLSHFILTTWSSRFRWKLSPQIIWQKIDSAGGEELIAIGSRVDRKLGAFHDYRVLFADATTSVLFIPRSTYYHGGYYKCSLSDGGFLHQMMHVNVTRPQMVMRHPLENTRYIAPGAQVLLKCDVTFAYPPPLIYWTFGRPRMQKSARPVAWVSDEKAGSCANKEVTTVLHKKVAIYFFVNQRLVPQNIIILFSK